MEPHETQVHARDIHNTLLKQYEQRKFAIAEIIRSAQAIDGQDETLRSDSRELLARLAEDRFNLMVVGRFSRGKSTLMNAILGGDFLPTGIVPLTSVITTVRYGSRKQAVVNFAGSRLTHDVPLARLAEYVSQKENPGNVKQVAYAELQLPLEILRRGLFFVDSPGLGSPIVENTSTTEIFLPQADAFVLVTSYESPLSVEEDRILQRIRNTGKKLFVVLNKQDMANEVERNEAIQFVTDRIGHFSFQEKPRFFSISARQGLEAKQKRDSVQLETSGLQQFESELMRFLIEERAQSFLSNMYERTMSFLTQRAHSLEHAEHENRFRVLTDGLYGLRETVLGTSAAQQEWPKGDSNSSVSPLPDVNRKTGCRICGIVLDRIFRFLSKYQYDLSINSEVQRDHAQRGGFCQVHTWQYEGISSPQGVCESYPKLVYRLAGKLRDFALYDTRDGLHALLPDSKTCPVCQTRAEAERQAIDDIVASLPASTASDFRAPACCLPHLALLIDAIGPGAIARTILASHAALLERTAEDLQRYALKHDALRRHLSSEEERSASQLALLLLAGHRNVSSPWVIEPII